MMSNGVGFLSFVYFKFVRFDGCWFSYAFSECDFTISTLKDNIFKALWLFWDIRLDSPSESHINSQPSGDQNP